MLSGGSSWKQQNCSYYSLDWHQLWWETCKENNFYRYELFWISLMATVITINKKFYKSKKSCLFSRIHTLGSHPGVFTEVRSLFAFSYNPFSAKFAKFYVHMLFFITDINRLWGIWWHQSYNYKIPFNISLACFSPFQSFIGYRFHFAWYHLTKTSLWYMIYGFILLLRV